MTNPTVVRAMPRSASAEAVRRKPKANGSADEQTIASSHEKW